MDQHDDHEYRLVGRVVQLSESDPRDGPRAGPQASLRRNPASCGAGLSPVFRDVLYGPPAQLIRHSDSKHEWAVDLAVLQRRTRHADARRRRSDTVSVRRQCLLPHWKRYLYLRPRHAIFSHPLGRGRKRYDLGFQFQQGLHDRLEPRAFLQDYDPVRHLSARHPLGNAASDRHLRRDRQSRHRLQLHHRERHRRQRQRYADR